MIFGGEENRLPYNNGFVAENTGSGDAETATTASARSTAEMVANGKATSVTQIAGAVSQEMSVSSEMNTVTRAEAVLSNTMASSGKVETVTSVSATPSPSNMLRMWGVRIDGVDLENMGLSLFDRNLPILPEAEENTVKLAGADGVLDFGNTYGPRLISLTLEVISPPAEFQMTLALLARMLKRSELTLEFRDMPGKFYKCVNSGTLALESPLGSRLVNVSLRMNDPWPTGAERVSETTITQSPTVIEIESNADVNAQPVITMTNTGTNTVHGFTITNEYDYQ